MASSGRRDVERLVAKFCACLRDCVRLEPQRSTSCCNGDAQLPWLCVRFDDELTRQNTVRDSRWRRMRELLEAVSILSMVACCRAFSLQRNPVFWRHFLEVECRVRSSAAEAFDVQCRGNSMAKMPKFLLDFSFMDVTPELLKLCRSFLTVRRRAKKCMRINFVAAMTQLKAIAKQQNCSRAEKIQIGFIFNRCGLQRLPPQPSSSAKGVAVATGTMTAAAQGSTVQQLQELIGDIAARAVSIGRHQSSAEQQQHAQKNKVLGVDPTAWGCFFYQVVLLEVSASELVKKDFARIAHIVSDPNGRLQEIVLNKIFSNSNSNSSEQEYASAFGTLMSACFSVSIDSGRSPEPELEGPAAEESKALASCRQQDNLWRLGFDWNVLNLNRLSSLFSAIHVSSRIERSVWDLSLVGSFRRFDGDPTLPWAWLAFGVFHATSQSRIQSLDLSTNTLCHDDVNAMKRVLTMTNYQKELLGSDEVLYSENRVVSEKTQFYCVAHLKKQTKLWPTNYASGKVLLQLNDESVWFEVFQHGTRWTCVLVPGYGVLWTRTKMVLKIENRERQILPETSRLRLKKLMLNSMVVKESERINHVFRELLPLVGGSLLHLELRSNPLSNIALGAIVSSCPHLQYLDVSACELQTIGAILDSYERSQCRIASLVMPENYVHEQEVRRLCSLLRDRSSSANSAAANLRYLDLDQNPIGRQGLLAIGKVLASNRVLQIVILSKSEDPDGQLRGRFAIHEDEFLGVQPLNAQQQLAMLSAAREVRAMAAIDVHVLQTVFAFAGTHVHRRIVWK